MRVSELSDRSGVSVATLKYYLREGLLHPGHATSATSASYDESHVERVRLVRALMVSGGLSVAAARRVVAALDEPPPTRHQLLGAAQYALDGGGDDGDRGDDDDRPTGTGGVRDGATALLDALGWHVSEDAPARRALARALDAATGAGLDLSPRALKAYARAMHRVAEIDVRAVPRDSPEAALRHVVVGTVLLDPVLVALRRLAQEDVSSREG